MIIKRRIVITFILAISLLFGMTTVSFAENTEKDTTATVEFEKKTGVNVLEIVTAPAIDFGTNDLPIGAATFKAKTISDDLEIRDTTGDNSGWSVSAKLSTFINGLNSNSMPGAFITLANGAATREGTDNTGEPTVVGDIELLSGATDATGVVSADVNKGIGTWIIEWVTGNVELNVLDIPAHGENSATITWILTAGPGE